MNKILMYTTNKIYTGERITGGIKRFLMLYEGLINKGYDVDLYCGETAENLKALNKNAKSINSEYITKIKIFPNIIIMLKNLKLLLKLKKKHYDKVIVFDVPTATSICLLKFKNINLFLRQDIIEYRKIILSNQTKSKLYKLIYLKFIQFCEYICCKNAKKIIVQCNYDAQNLLLRHGLTKKKIQKKIFVQINNVNAHWIAEKSNIISTKANTAEFNIGFIGDFSNARKGHDILLPVVNNMIKKEFKIKLYVIGDGNELEIYKDKYEQNKNIIFLGRMNNPIEIVKKMDLMIVPSLADSCPNTILEAMYNNVLVIGTNVGGIPELITDSNALFEPNIDNLQQKLQKIITDSNYRNNIKNNQEIRKKQLTFSWEDKIIEIFKK